MHHIEFLYVCSKQSLSYVERVCIECVFACPVLIRFVASQEAESSSAGSYLSWLNALSCSSPQVYFLVVLKMLSVHGMAWYFVMASRHRDMCDCTCVTFCIRSFASVGFLSVCFHSDLFCWLSDSHF